MNNINICKILLLQPVCNLNVNANLENILIETKSRILQINQTQNNTYFFKILILDKENNNSNVIDRDNEYNYGDNSGNNYPENANRDVNIVNEISIAIFPEEILFMKKFLDVKFQIFIIKFYF